MKDLHVLPKFSDRWSYIYLEHGRIDVDGSSLVLKDKDGDTAVPICQLGVVFLGPGTRITQAAMKAMAENNCLACWTGEQGVRLYAHSTGGTHSAVRLLRQAQLYCDPQLRLGVVRRMYQKRFPEALPEKLDIQQVRGMEGSRVRNTYQVLAREYKVEWQGRLYDQDAWDHADPLNRALSSANACLYGICHAAILSAGYSPAIGFIHVGKMLSFVYDVADLYKTELSVPLAFRTVAESTQDVERRVRLACRDAFHEGKLMDRILPDIGEVLDARNDIGEIAGEFEGRAVSMA
ncbi:MAG TPA: type I-E CRISPR-associated endonuclease Cas1e [Planctomycetota bacterium]|nr:type I-E CRISPR-associated endonuclease Cas1e [Planctomycetota bacterium]